MKRIKFTVFIIVMFGCFAGTKYVLAQPIMSEKTKADITIIQRNMLDILRGDEQLINQFPIIKIGETYYVSFIGKLHENYQQANELEKPNVLIGAGVGKIRSIRIPIDKLNDIHLLYDVQYLELSTKIVPNLSRVRFDTRTDSVSLSLDFPQSYTGKNVLIGMQDWGYDYTHPMFYDTLLQHTRILAAWDQFKQSGPNPTDFLYGTEYNNETELLAAKGDTSNQLRYATHATHVAGIAGGSGAGKFAMGMAPEARFLFTTPRVDEAAALDSWKWMHQKAQEQQKKLVVNMSWGLYHYGTNDGTSLLSQAISEYTQQGVLFVSSAGNNGDDKFHFQKEFNNDSVFSQVKFYNYAVHDSMWGQSIHAWGEVGKNFEVKFQVRQNTGNLLDETDYFLTSNNGYTDSFLVVNTNDTIWYNITREGIHPQNSRPTVRLRIKNTKPSLSIDLVARASSGTVHFWNLIELTTNGGNWGSPFIAVNDNYVGGDDSFGIGEPACAKDAISVAAHRSEFLQTDGVTLVGGARASFSSIGPLYNGDLKPDISAPGYQVLSSLSSFTTETHAKNLFVEFNGKKYYFDRFSGTSMSSPVVAGICALIWEANPYLTPYQIKDIVMQTAREDEHTGEIPAEGSVQWGFGKINAKSAIEKAIQSIGLGENNVYHQKEWSIYPNPSTNTVSVHGLSSIEKVQLITQDGKTIELSPQENSWSLNNLSNGVYLLRIQSESIIYQQKIIKQ